MYRQLAGWSIFADLLGDCGSHDYGGGIKSRGGVLGGWEAQTAAIQFHMGSNLAHVTYLVRDYDEAIEYFTTKLGFELLEDTPVGEGKRWVLVAPPAAGGASLLLAKAATPEQAALIGRQAGGRVFLFLHTDDFWRDYQAMQSRGVVFKEAPRAESYGTVAVFEDLYGNKWDLIQHASSAAATPQPSRS